MPQANSTMSMPRVTSPCASVKTLPCSAVIIAASVSRCWFSSSRNLFRMRARRIGGVSAQAGNAAFAAATAAFTSSTEPSATCRATAPVDGFQTGWRRPLVLATLRPLMKWPTSVVAVKKSRCAHILGTRWQISGAVCHPASLLAPGTSLPKLKEAPRIATVCIGTAPGPGKAHPA